MSLLVQELISSCPTILEGLCDDSVIDTCPNEEYQVTVNCQNHFVFPHLETVVEQIFLKAVDAQRVACILSMDFPR